MLDYDCCKGFLRPYDGFCDILTIPTFRPDRMYKF